MEVRRRIVGLPRAWAVGLLGVGLAGAFYAGVAYAADARLDEADAAVQKAIALLQAAQDPGVNPPFGGHRDEAIKDLQRARTQIQKAKAFADDPTHHKNKAQGKNTP